MTIEYDPGPPKETLACAVCGDLLAWTRGEDVTSWRPTSCWAHPQAQAISRAEGEALKREKGRRRALVDAAMLRALAAVIESSGDPLDAGGNITSASVQQEIGRRLR